VSYRRENGEVGRLTLTGRIYARAIGLSQRQNQVVGEKNDYYVTLAQLEEILQSLKAENPPLDIRRMVRPGDEPLA